jgi:hypothetical protein
MELKNVNLDGHNIVASNANKVKFYCSKIEKIEFKNKHCMFIFLEDVMIS